jgi:hypothetical protein
MPDLAATFKSGPPQKGAYLSRLFGIFNEEVIRIWASDPRSPYEVSPKRPTLYEMGKPYTLDFLFMRDGRSFVGEMKCEIQYQDYVYWRLSEPQQLEHHRNKKAFQLFLALSMAPSSVRVRVAGGEVEVHGSVLVWGAATADGIEAVKKQYGIADVLTIEGCIADLISWESESYLRLLQERESWASSLFRALRGECGA